MLERERPLPLPATWVQASPKCGSNETSFFQKKQKNDQFGAIQKPHSE